MPGLLLAQPTSDNAPAGAFFTLWFPLGLFIIVIAILWVLLARPHQRVPARRPAQAQGGGATAATASGSRAVDAGAGGPTSGARPSGAASAAGGSGASAAAGGRPEPPGQHQQPGDEDLGPGE